MQIKTSARTGLIYCMHLPEALPEYSAVWIIKCFLIARTSRTLWALLLHAIYAKKSERQIDMFLMYGNLCPLCPPLHWFYYTSHIIKHNIGGMALNKRIQFQWDKEQHWVFCFCFYFYFVLLSEVLWEHSGLVRGCKRQGITGIWSLHITYLFPEHEWDIRKITSVG